MAKYEQKYVLDYRYGGDTVDDFAQKHMGEMTRIFRFLNDLRSNTTNIIEYTEPVAGQLKVEDDKLYIRNSGNTDWIYLGALKDCFGFKDVAASFLSTDDLSKDKIATINDVDMTTVLTTSDLTKDKIATINNLDMNKALTTDNISDSKVSDINNLDFSKVLTDDDIGTDEGKIPEVGSDGLLPVSVSGNAGKIAGYSIQTFGVKDGEALMYSASLNGWTNQDISVIGGRVELDDQGDIMPMK